jgi:hypothetical protein
MGPPLTVPFGVTTRKSRFPFPRANCKPVIPLPSTPLSLAQLGRTAVPLLDHFHRPWKTLRPWEGFHSTWATTLAQKLNHGWLPRHHFAVPNVHLGNRLEIDVANLEEETAERSEEAGAATNATTATAVWAPPRPTVSGPVDFTDPELFEVRVFDEQDTPRLVAAIELVSPSNKDRASHRQAFGIMPNGLT